MSGETDANVELRESEKNRMMSACRRIDNVGNNVRQNMQQANRQLRREMDQQLAQINLRYDRFEQNLGNMSANMQRVERQNIERLRNLAKEFHQDMSNLDDRLEGRMSQQKKEISQEVQQHRQAIDGQLQKQRHENSQRFQQVSHNIDKLSQNLDRFRLTTDQRKSMSNGFSLPRKAATRRMRKRILRSFRGMKYLRR